jgi:protein TonB
VPSPPAPPAPPVQQSPVRREFKAAYRVEPSFPPQAIRQGISGKVIAWVHVAPAGNVTQVEIKQSSNRLFDREVIRALSQWKFNPEPVGFIGEYEIVFNLKD